MILQRISKWPNGTNYRASKKIIFTGLKVSASQLQLLGMELFQNFKIKIMAELLNELVTTLYVEQVCLSQVYYLVNIRQLGKLNFLL